ncbi:ABC-2 family transporter protein [Kineococcus sp. TBRC 1896]|uniref:ABC-2 family transporter protein n=1 Tax=Kineococcus mangrovi TaxID=1660183 RepID=A0ABV4I1X8_9ACTN
MGVVSLVAGVSVSFAARWIVNLTAFWLTEVRGILLLYTVLATTLTGLSIPVAWFPPWLNALAHATPFPSMLQTPVDVVLGRAADLDALRLLGVQLGWLAALLAAGRVLLAAGARRLVVQGG